MSPPKHTDIATRALIVALKSPLVGKTTAKVHQITGIPVRTINYIYARACERGFDPNRRPVELKDSWLKDLPRSGRPKKQIVEAEEALELKIRRDRCLRERPRADLAGELSRLRFETPAFVRRRMLRGLGRRKTKPTRKPGLTQMMRGDRTRCCRRERVKLDA